MASSVPVQGLDDDDGFDWDAAVREIDAACIEATKQSSSGVTATSATICQNSNLHTGSCPKPENNKPASSRQSTLDKFIGFTGVKSKNQNVRHDAQDKVECGDEILSDVSIDPEAAKTWIYPENPPVREYQESITRTALFSNTLVSLPTGLGKTLIAAVVMYNYYRWFPEGKIVFAAPSRPLVVQQIEACHKIVGIPQKFTVEMTGGTCPAKRAALWKEKRIFYLTPQVLANDIKDGLCEVKKLVCLVLDEAHKASGEYAYCVAFRMLMAVPVRLRLLALTATPGSNVEKVQDVIDNLQISSLEHRSETDPDVAPYLHVKDVELMKVEMGKDAVEVNDLLLDVTRPFQSRLSNLGVLINSTLTVTNYLDSWKKFNQAPPPNLAQLGHGEVEGTFAVLIALYHIRKQLSGYGIRPAFETLEDKLKEGSFKRFVSRNESLQKAKAIMQQYLSRGDLSPKFLKLLEVVDDHFKKHDPQKSRVIIFSNYRGSVSEIMESLEKVGSYIKATEFIGQTSGKKSKGQTQKAQQAVLEKFRAGGYNVIVATSIGEEGLDIMEVDLVICFDANISALRMTQRMGRTGRKNKGRVVVLACIGSELDGYMKKQAGGKAIRKRMLNGGTNSFRFHPSPRMVPRMFRPAKVVEKLLIEKYVDRGKKVKKDGDAIQIPKYKLKLTDMERDLLAKYFNSSSKNEWKPSLIAFPHFQAFPSRIHKVAHSSTTLMLIDTMQSLQNLSFNYLDEEASQGYLKVESIEHQDNNIREDDPPQQEAEIAILSSPIKHDSPDVVIQSQKLSHSFLFGSDFISINSLGRVTLLSVPSFPLLTKTSSPQNIPSMSNFSPVNMSAFDTTPEKSQGNDDLLESSRRNTNTTTHDVLDDSEAAFLSPRLTNLFICGVVPESPIIAEGFAGTPKGHPTPPDHDIDTSISLVQNEGEVPIPAPEIESPKFMGETETPTHVTKLPSDNINDSCGSKDWMINSGENSVTQKPRLKRLRRYGDVKSGNFSDVDHLSNKRGRGDKEVFDDARIFIDNEAEVSSEGSGDEDEDVDQGQDSYDDSFIDDRINPTAATTQAECDMMAIYRRSLLTQSPAMPTPQFPMDKNTPTHQMHDDGSTGTTNHTNTSNYSTSVSFNTNRPTSDAGIPTTTTGIPTTTIGIPSTDTGIRKRKLSFSHGQSESLPIRNLEKELSLEAESRANEAPWKAQGEVMYDFDDDDFYRDIDVDALVEAARKSKSEAVKESEVVKESEATKEKPNDQNLDFFDCPSFDLDLGF